MIWCTEAFRIELPTPDPFDPIQPGMCTDLWVHIDPDTQTLNVDLEGFDLASHLTDDGPCAGTTSVALADDLGVALAMVAEHLDAFLAEAGR